MPRIARKDIISNYNHVMVQGIERKYIFEGNQEKNKYSNLLFNNLKHYKNMYVLAYCIMDNHVHLLIYCEEIENLSRLMSQTNTSYARWYNKKENRVGYVFRDRFNVQQIEDNEHLFNCLAYIHNNPVKAKKVKDIKDYSYSSYNLYKEKKMQKAVIKKIFNQTNYMEQFDYIHKNFNEEGMLDVSAPKTSLKDVEKIIKQFCIKNQINIEILRKNNYFIGSLLKEIRNDRNTNNVSNKQISEYLKIGKNRITNILKQN